MRVVVDVKPKDASECPFRVETAGYWGCSLNRELPCELLCDGECHQLIALNGMVLEES